MAGLTQSFNTCGNNGNFIKNDRQAQMAMAELRRMDPEHRFTDRSGNEPMSSHDQRAQHEALQKLEHSGNKDLQAGVAKLKGCMQTPKMQEGVGVMSEHAKRMQRMQSRPGGMGM